MCMGMLGNYMCRVGVCTQAYTDMSHARTSRMAVASSHAGQQLLKELLSDKWGPVEVSTDIYCQQEVAS